MNDISSLGTDRTFTSPCDYSSFKKHRVLLGPHFSPPHLFDAVPQDAAWRLTSAQQIYVTNGAFACCIYKNISTSLTLYVALWRPRGDMRWWEWKKKKPHTFIHNSLLYGDIWVWNLIRCGAGSGQGVLMKLLVIFVQASGLYLPAAGWSRLLAANREKRRDLHAWIQLQFSKAPISAGNWNVATFSSVMTIKPSS